MNLRGMGSAIGCVSALAAGSIVAAAQSNVTRVKYSVACQTCKVEFTQVAKVGKRSDPARLAELTFLDRDRQGRFFAIGDDFQVLVYDAHGTFLRALGRRGDGPGEFSATAMGAATAGGARMSDVVVGRGDTVFVFQPPKVSVFSPQLEYVRTITTPRLPSIGSINPLSNGTWLVSAALNGPQQVGFSLHTMGADGSISRSWGPETAVTPEKPRTVSRFRLSPDKRTVWFFSTDHRFSLEHWSIENKPLRHFQVYDVPYLPMPRYVTLRGRVGGRTIQSAVGSGAVSLTGIDTLGNLWMFGRPPAPDTVNRFLEIVDGRTGATLSSQRVDNPMWLLRSGDLAYSASTDADGILSFTVWSFRFLSR